MAYSTPKQWIHGELVIAGEMEKYNDSIDALNTAFASFGAPTAGYSLQNVAGTDIADGRWYFIHTHRYLWYKGKGFITHPDDGTIQMSLSETATDTTWERFDLSTVDWIYPGLLYEVTEVDGAMELWR